MLLTLTENVIIQSELEKQIKNQIWEKKFSNLSDFEFNFSNASDFGKKISKRVRVWFKTFKMRQILDWKKYNALEFELKNFDMSGFEKMFASKKSRFGSFYSVKTTYFAFLLLFLESIILNWKFQYASDFDLEVLQCVRFEIENKLHTTRQIFS